MLQNEDIDILLDALDGLEAGNRLAGGGFGDFVAVMNSSAGLSPMQIEEAVAKRRCEVREKQAALRDRVILLKAKLVGMREQNSPARSREAIPDRVEVGGGPG